LSEPPTLTHSVINTIPSMNPQELRKNALGVQKKPSAITLIVHHNTFVPAAVFPY
jgi:hypothetical protein